MVKFRQPKIDYNRLVAFSVNLLLVSIGYFLIFFIARRTYRIASATGCILNIIASALFLMWCLELISDRFTGSGFNPSVVFHLLYGLDGAGFNDFVGIIATCSALLVVGSLAWIKILKIGNTNKDKPSRAASGIVFALGSAIIWQHPVTKVGKQMLFPHPSEIGILNQYVNPKITSRPLTPPNIVWIYGESLERTYFNENLFPDLMPNLKKIETESLSFDEISQIGQTGWTIAGLVSSQCGIPLVTTGGNGNSMRDIPKFLPGTTCLGDLLNSEGYHMSFMGGADLSFAGKGRFLSDHGFESTFGFTELKENLTDPDYKTDWGIFDDSLFDLAAARFQELSSKNKPFGLFVLTLNTHHPFGHIPKVCEKMKYDKEPNSILNAVHCSDFLIGKFVEKIRKIDKNTLVVIASDHLAMRNTAYDKLNTVPRKNLLIYHWPEKISPNINSRKDGTFSSGTTALNLMGFANNGIGLGRNLLGPQKNMVERFPNPEDTLNSWENDLRKLWQLPQQPRSIFVDITEKLVQISGSKYQIPLILDISKNDSTLRLFFDETEEPLSQVIARLGSETRSIWVDSCAKIQSFTLSAQLENLNKICIWDDGVKQVKILDNSWEYSIQL